MKDILMVIKELLRKVVNCSLVFAIIAFFYVYGASKTEIKFSNIDQKVTIEETNNLLRKNVFSEYDYNDISSVSCVHEYNYRRFDFYHLNLIINNNPERLKSYYLYSNCNKNAERIQKYMASSEVETCSIISNLILIKFFAIFLLFLVLCGFISTIRGIVEEFIANGKKKR